MVFMAKSVYIIDNLITQITHVHASDPINTFTTLPFSFHPHLTKHCCTEIETGLMLLDSVRQKIE